MKDRKQIVLEWIRVVVGLYVFAIGVHFTIRANIGLAPWDCFAMGLSYHLPINYGTAVTAISVVVVAVDLLLRERIGWGTVLDALLVGNFTQWINQHSPLQECTTIWGGALLMCAGLGIMALGQFVYMRAGQCCGPRDSLLVGLGKRVKKIPIGLVNLTISATVLCAGWLLGGPVGVGTVISAFGVGIMMQLVFGLLRFEPRDVVHKDIVAVTRRFLGR